MCGDGSINLDKGWTHRGRDNMTNERTKEQKLIDSKDEDLDMLDFVTNDQMLDSCLSFIYLGRSLLKASLMRKELELDVMKSIVMKHMEITFDLDKMAISLRDIDFRDSEEDGRE